MGCSPLGAKESDTTQQRNNSAFKYVTSILIQFCKSHTNNYISMFFNHPQLLPMLGAQDLFTFSSGVNFKRQLIQ